MLLKILVQNYKIISHYLIFFIDKTKYNKIILYLLFLNKMNGQM
jgi:hypothetical protein